MNARHAFSGRLAIITGAARGLGLAVAERLVRGGASVVLADSDAERVRGAAEHLSGSGTAEEPFPST